MKREDIPPLFRSGHEACRFAFSYSHQQYPMTIMSRLMKGEGIGSGRGLVGLEGAAVAGTVKRHVESLGLPHSSVIAARYEICQRSAIGHVVLLAGMVLGALGTGVHNRRMVQELVMYYFRIPGQDGNPVKLAAIADRYGVHASTVTRAWKPIKERLRAWESTAETAADARMVEAGLAP